MKKFSKKDTISVYQFMDMCGLMCQKKTGVLISNNAMYKKLLLRHRSFPDDVFLPVRLPFHLITVEFVKRGKILLVEDDYGKILPYEKPELSMRRIYHPSKEEVIQERSEETLPAGYLKYLVKKNKRELEEEQQRIQEALAMDQEDIQNGFTEDQVKVRKIGKRMY